MGQIIINFKKELTSSMKFVSLILAAMMGSTADARMHQRHAAPHSQPMNFLNQQHSRRHPAMDDEDLKIFYFIAGKIDKNQDHAIEESELEYLYKFVSKEYGYTPTARDMEYVNNFFMKIDKNGDNKVTEEEFMDAYNKGLCKDFLGGLGHIARAGGYKE